MPQHALVQCGERVGSFRLGRAEREVGHGELVDAQGAVLVEQFDQLEPRDAPGQKINGSLTVGENIGDLGGLQIAFKAYKASLGGKPAPVIDGFTGEQRFFYSFAHAWRSKYRDAALLQQVTTDPHTPGFLRPNVVRNLDAWYVTFGVKPGQALYLKPEERLKVW